MTAPTKKQLDQLVTDCLYAVLDKVSFQAAEETLEPKVRVIKERVLESYRNRFDYDAANAPYADRKRIDPLSAETLTLDNMFLLHGEDAGPVNQALLVDYYREVQSGYAEAGIPPKKSGNCPYLEFNALKVTAERKIVTAFADLCEVDFGLLCGRERWKECVDLITGAAIRKFPEEFKAVQNSFRAA